MKESSTYQYILDEGRIEETRKLILMLGRRRMGAPGKGIHTALQGIRNLKRLERMFDRLLKAGSWDELLETR